MTIILNGKDVLLPDNSTLADAVAHLTPDAQRVIAEMNGVIINRTEWKTTPLKPGTTLELITFVGGG